MSSLALVTIIQVSLLGAQESGFDRAYQQSVATGRPLVVLIGADWCPACQRMKNSTLPQAARAGGLSKVVFTYVDLDRQRELASRLSRTKSIPQLIRFDQTQSGWKGQLLVGAKSRQEVQAFINAGLGHTNESGKRTTSSNNAQEDDYTRAYNRSLVTGYPLIVLLGARWCPACQKMKKSVLPQVAEAGGLNNAEFVYVDFDRQPDLAARLSRGKSIPQLIRLEKTQAGWNSRVLVGAKNPREVHTFVNADSPAAADQRSPADSARDKVVSPNQSDWTGIFSAMNPFPVKRAQGGNGHTLPK